MEAEFLELVAAQDASRIRLRRSYWEATRSSACSSDSSPTSSNAGIGLFCADHGRVRRAAPGPRRADPGTLNIGHTLTIVQAVIYITLIAAHRSTPALLVAAAVVGAWFGAGIVCGWEKRRVQRGMAIALLGTAAFIVLRIVPNFPGGGDGALPSGVCRSSWPCSETRCWEPS